VFALPTRIDRIGRVSRSGQNQTTRGPFKFIVDTGASSLDNFAPSCCGARASILRRKSACA